MSKLNFTLEQVQKLFKMQDELNTYIHPQWKDQNFDWYEAIIDECGEIKGHLGWKWWKKDYKCGVHEGNKAQIKLEVIDILHFLVSGLADGSWTPKDFIWQCENALCAPETSFDYVVTTARMDCVNGYYPTRQWALMAQLLDMTAEEIMETYVQKYVLNKFRQDHGYKTGEYCKEWEYQQSYDDCVFNSFYLEDNEVLAKEVAHLNLEGQDITNETILYERLELRYNSRLNK